MPDKHRDIESRIDRLLRYIELLELNLKEVKEQIETKRDVDKYHDLMLRLSQAFKCRKNK
jgi:hypothetical protein